jgi:hypothetical protein
MTLLPEITTHVKILFKEGTFKLAFFGGKFSHFETKKIGISWSVWSQSAEQFIELHLRSKRSLQYLILSANLRQSHKCRAASNIFFNPAIANLKHTR